MTVVKRSVIFVEGAEAAERRPPSPRGRSSPCRHSWRCSCVTDADHARLPSRRHVLSAGRLRRPVGTATGWSCASLPGSSTRGRAHLRLLVVRRVRQGLDRRSGWRAASGPAWIRRCRRGGSMRSRVPARVRPVGGLHAAAVCLPTAPCWRPPGRRPSQRRGQGDRGALGAAGPSAVVLAVSGGSPEIAEGGGRRHPGGRRHLGSIVARRRVGRRAGRRSSGSTGEPVRRVLGADHDRPGLISGPLPLPRHRGDDLVGGPPGPSWPVPSPPRSRPRSAGTDGDRRDPVSSASANFTPGRRAVVNSTSRRLMDLRYEGHAGGRRHLLVARCGDHHLTRVTSPYDPSLVVWVSTTAAMLLNADRRSPSRWDGTRPPRQDVGVEASVLRPGENVADLDPLPHLEGEPQAVQGSPAAAAPSARELSSRSGSTPVRCQSSSLAPVTISSGPGGGSDAVRIR